MAIEKETKVKFGRQCRTKDRNSIVLEHIYFNSWIYIYLLYIFHYWYILAGCLAETHRALLSFSIGHTYSGTI